MFRAGTEHPELLEHNPTHFRQTPALDQTNISEPSYAQEKSMEEHSQVSIVKKHPHISPNCLYRTQGSGHCLFELCPASKQTFTSRGNKWQRIGKETKENIYIYVKQQARSQLSSPQNKKTDGSESEQTWEYLCSGHLTTPLLLITSVSPAKDTHSLHLLTLSIHMFKTTNPCLFENTPDLPTHFTIHRYCRVK